MIACPNKKFTLFVICLIFLLAGSFVYWQKTLQRTNLNQKVKIPVELASGFPTIAVFSGAVLVASQKKETSDGTNYRAEWETSATVPQVSRWYQENLDQTGWLIDIMPADTNNEQVQMLVAKKVDQVVNLSFIRQGSTKTAIVAEIPTPWSGNDE